MYQGRSNRADTEDAHGDEIQNDGEDDQSDELQAKAAFQHIFQLDFAGAISNGVGGRSGRQHESKVAGQHAGDHHGKGTDSDSLAHTGQDRDKGGHDHGVGSQFSENSGDNTNQNYNQDGVHARQAGEHIGDPLRATGIPEGVAHDHGAAQQNNGVPGDVIEAGLPVADVLTFLIIHRCNHNQDCTEHGDSFIRGIGEPVTPDQRTGDPQDDTQNEHGGTLFLDEIGEIPRETQVELLRVLQEKEIRRVGGSRVIPVDVRIIAATNKDLLQETVEGRFREDLYYRLDVLDLKLPPLRERGDDVKILGLHLFRQLPGGKDPIMQSQFLYLLEQAGPYQWYGNIRELQNFVERANILMRNAGASSVTVSDILRRRAEPAPEPCQETESRDRRAIEAALHNHPGSMADAARSLGCSRQTLWRKMKKYGIQR